MEKIEYKKIAEMEKTYWWHVGKITLLNSLLSIYFDKPHTQNIKLLEIGCGTGEVLKNLSSWGEVTGIDISLEAINYCKRLNLKNLIEGDFNALDLTNHLKKYDVVVALDVLEHVQDDLQAIKRAQQVLKKGGLFFVNVPAHKFLWSEHDEALHHKRRYRMNEITQKLSDGGFTILKKTYFVSVAFPAIAFLRVLSNFVKRDAYPKTSYVMLPAFLNLLMIKVLELEAKIVKKSSLPMGTTIAIVAKKIS